MTLNEILLLIAIVVLLIIPSLLVKRISQPLKTYVNLATGLLLLILVWFFAGDGSLPLKVVITTFVIKSAIETIKEYKEFARRADVENY